MVDPPEYPTLESQRTTLDAQLRLLANVVEKRENVSFPSISDYGNTSNDFLVLLAAVVIPVVFGLPDLLAWNAPFPHHVELTLWRIATVTVMFTGALEAIAYGVITSTRDRAFRFKSSIVYLSVVIPILCHIISSLYLTVQSCRQLFFLPDDVFKLPSFSQYIPHLF